MISALMQFDFLKRLFVKAPAKKPVVSRAPKSASAKNQTPTPPNSEKLLAEARALLIAQQADRLASALKLRWNPRMRSTAGMAYWRQSLITLNPRLIEFGEDEIQRTLRHELAHLLAHDRAKGRRISPHGAEWKRACRDLGLADEKRTHELPLPRREIARKLFYRCPSCAVEIARVKPLSRGAACIRCCRRHNRGRYDARYRFEKVESRTGKVTAKS